MNEEPKRGRGRPRKGAEPRKKRSVGASDETWIAWEREAARRSRPGATVSIADLFEEIGESFAKVVVI